MGEVWRGVHREQQVPVAIKVITTDYAREVAHLRAFEREVEAIAGLEHPGIVMVLDYGTIPPAAELAAAGQLIAGSPYLAMELGQRGLSLGEAWPWSRLRTLLLAMLDGLAHAHARGVVHRDLKPANVLLFGEDESVVKLADFGIAWVGGRDAATSSAGTPNYMAPEQIVGEWLDFGPWTDLYALACMSWRLVTGRYAFASRNIRLAKLKGETGAFRPRYAVPPGFEAWLRGLLVRDPHKRVRRAADAAFQLRQLGAASRSPVIASAAPVRSVPAVTRIARPTRIVEPIATSLAGEATPVEFEAPPMSETWARATVARSTHLFGAGLALYGLRRPAMVGRTSERDAIWSTLRGVVTRARAQAVILHGAAGTGKSRLAQWLGERAHELGAATPLKAVHSGGGSPVDGLAPMVARHLRCVGLSRAEVAERVGHLRLGDADENEALTELISPRMRAERGAPKVQMSRGDRIHVVRRLFQRLSSDRALVVWLDDAQWGQEALDLAKAVLDAETGPVLLVLTVRDEALDVQPAAADKLAELASRLDVVDLEVQALQPSERAELVRDLLGLNIALAEQVERRTAGVPLFAVQLIGDWVQRGMLVLGEDGFQLRDGVTPELPDALHGLWIGRIEHLLQAYTAKDRTALELAAVLGRHVDATEWRAVCDRLEIAVSEGLVDQMVARALARRTQGEDWVFEHGMLGESLVRDAREAGRLDRHRAACAETLYELAVTLRVTGQSQAAEARLQRALKLATDPARGGVMRGELGETQFEMGWIEQAHGNLDAALAVHREVGDRHNEGIVLRNLGNVHRMHGRVEEAFAHFNAALALYRELGDRGAEAMVLGSLGILLRLQIRMDEARVAFEAALAVHRELGDRRLEANVRNSLGTLHLDMGRMGDARLHYEAALALYRALGNQRYESIVLGNLGRLHFELGQSTEALLHYEAALAVHRDVGDRPNEGIVLVNLGNLHLNSGRFQEARRCYESAFVAHREVGNKRAEAIVYGNLGDLHFELGELDAAEEALNAGLALLDEVGIQNVQGAFLGTLALVHGQRGEIDSARRCLDRGEKLLREAKHPTEVAKLLCKRARIEWDHGDVPGARDALGQARVIGAELSASPESELGRTLIALGDQIN